MRDQKNGFWSGGLGALLAALREEEAQALAALKRAVKAERDPNAERALKEQIKQIKAEFTNKRKAARSSLF